ncbi:MAG: Hsp70 family protein, partial [Aeromicrobium sp.]|uniref:Hsp70 family protein n=1 Tax=Aeromicrobium sp. TaxID=1871063 RepID=UPI0039E6D195
CRYQDKDEQVSVTRADFEEATRHLLTQTLDTARRTVKTAQEKASGLTIDRVLLAGGSARMPMVDEALRSQLGWDPQPTGFDLAVAQGAAIHARRLLDAARRERQDA